MDLTQIKNIIVILSGKGGVGKSSIASLLGVSLAKTNNVCIMDLDITGPSIHTIMGCEEDKIIVHENNYVPIDIIPGFSFISIGVMVNQEEAMIWRGPMKHGIIDKFLNKTELENIDYLIIDTPPGTSDEHLSLVQLLGLTIESNISIEIESIKNKPNISSIIVTTPQRLSTNDVSRTIDFCKKTNLPILGIIENMSGFKCPECGYKHNLFLKGGGKSLSDKYGYEILGKIPFNPIITEICDSGKLPQLLVRGEIPEEIINITKKLDFKKEEVVVDF